MARVNGNVIGNLSGKLGNLAARTVNGVTILSARPASFLVSNSPDSVAARKRFAVTGVFSKYVFSIPALAEIWTKVKLPDLSVFNTIFKTNYPFTGADKPSEFNLLTPDGFGLPVTSATPSASYLAIELGALNTASDFDASEIDLSIAAVIVYHNPANPADPPYQIIKLVKEEAAFDFTAAYSGSISFTARQLVTAAMYQDNIVYLAVATKDAAGKIVQCSATYGAAS